MKTLLRSRDDRSNRYWIPVLLARFGEGSRNRVPAEVEENCDTQILTSKVILIDVVRFSFLFRR